MRFFGTMQTGRMQEFLKNAVVDAVPEKFWSFAASAACDFRVQSHVLQVPAHGEVPLAAAVGEVQRPVVCETVQVGSSAVSHVCLQSCRPVVCR